MFHFFTYQIIEDVPLVDVYGDEGFKLGPFDLGEFARGLVNQCVQQLQKGLVRLLHHFTVVLGVL